MKDADSNGHKLARRLRSDMPNAEYKLWQVIRRKQLAGHHFRRQLPIGRFVVDFACVKENLVVEIDGVGHSSDKDVVRDQKRTAYLEGKGWRVIRFWNDDVYDDIEGVVLAIAGHLSTATDAERIERE